MRKAQSAIEFVVLVSFMIFVFMGFLIITQNRIIETSNKNDFIYLSEINSLVKNEVLIASRAGYDFHREFDLPATINGKTYTIDIPNDGYEIVTSYGDKSYVNYFFFPVRGVLRPDSTNTIYKKSTRDTINNLDIVGVFFNIDPDECIFQHKVDDTCPDIDDENFVGYRTACKTLFNLCVG